MEHITNQSFEGENISLDGKTFLKCTLTRCTVTYAGGDFEGPGTQFRECQFQFTGPALRALTLWQNIVGNAQQVVTVKNKETQTIQ